MKKEYVVAFLFTPDFKDVWLIEKEKPAWQKGHMNGIGGKIEKHETPIDAAIREIKEESDLTIDVNELSYVGHMGGENNDNSSFKVTIFTGITDKQLRTMEEEEIYCIPVEKVKAFMHIENVPMLIETCIYYLKGASHFNELIMKY